MKNNIALKIARNAARKTNGKKFYFNDNEVAYSQYDESCKQRLISLIVPLDMISNSARYSTM